MSELIRKLGRVSTVRKAEKVGQEIRYKDSSKRKLLKAIGRKAKNIFIGHLAILEKHFGHLWGHGLAESQCNKQQLAWREIWERLRTETLNNGNSQLRAMEKEVSEYDVSWNRHAILLRANPPRDNPSV